MASETVFGSVEEITNGTFLQRGFLTFLFLYSVFFHCPVMFLRRYIWRCDHVFFIPMKLCLFVWTIILAFMLPHAGPDIFNALFYIPIILLGVLFFALYRLFDILYSHIWYPYFNDLSVTRTNAEANQRGGNKTQPTLPPQTALQTLNFNLRLLGLIVIGLVLFELWYFSQYEGQLITYLLLSSLVVVFYILESVLQAVLFTSNSKARIA